MNDFDNFQEKYTWWRNFNWMADDNSKWCLSKIHRWCISFM